MGRSPCCSKEGLNKGAWTAHEDEILIHYIKGHGEGRWRNLPKRAGLKRCGKSCRLRWLNYLRPGIKRGNISADEEELIIRLHKLLGNRWSLIAGRLPGRTDNEIKNYWNTNLGKKIQHRQENSAATAAATASKHNESNGRIMMKSEAAAAQLAPTSDVVVRTRATRCSKVFINPQFEQKVDPFDSNKESKPSTEGDWDRPTNQASASTPVDGLLPISENEETINNSSNFTLDVDKMGEFCLSDVLNFDFSDIGDLNYSKALSTSLDQPLIFSEETLQDWTNTASNLQHSLLPLLEYGEEWLVK